MLTALIDRLTGLLRPTAGDELAVTLWTLDLIDAAAECRRMHETCRRAKD